MGDNQIVVIDNGGSTIKAGMAGEDHPSVVVPNAIGLEDFANLSDPEIYAKYMQLSGSGDLKIRHPITNGAIIDWEDMEQVWTNVIHKHLLHVNPQENSVLITEPVGNPKPAREKIAEILLEKLNFNGISIATAPILPMYAAGRTTGIVLDVGDGVAQVVPVWGGYPITEAMKRADFGGRDITQLLSKEHANRQTLLHANKAPFEVYNLLKEKTCHVVLDYDQSKAGSSSTEFELPNGDKVQMAEEQFSCPEFLFNPSKFEETETNTVGVHQLLYKSIMKTNIDVRKDLYANIVLTGGSTLFPGFADRLEKELKELIPSSLKVKIVAHPARKYFTWIGGSVLASLTSFPSTMISKQSWEEGSGRAAIGKVSS